MVQSRAADLRLRALYNQLSDDPEARHSFMFKGLQEIHQKHEDSEMDTQERSANEMALARSGLLFFLGEYHSYLVETSGRQ